MKKFLCFLLMAALTIICYPVFAQDSSAVDSTGSGGGIGAALSANVVLVISIVLGLYELAVRYFPTVKNYSIISMVIKLLAALVPNNAKAGGTFESVKTTHPVLSTVDDKKTT